MNHPSVEILSLHNERQFQQNHNDGHVSGYSWNCIAFLQQQRSGAIHN
jgi:hypothetical protein